MKQILLLTLALAAWPATSTAAAEMSQGEVRPIHRTDPEFPSEAMKAGAARGKVTARMTLDANGKVTNVEIVDALPRRLFDRAVIKALGDWRYAEGAAGRAVEVEILFKRAD